MSKRNPTRLELIRKLPCVRCGKHAPSQACHSNFQKHGKGMGTKANDYWTIPMCYSCHREFDHYQSLNRAMAEEQFKQWHAITEAWLELDRVGLPF